MNDILRQDLIKDLERYLFGEEEYEEIIAEKVKTRRQNKDIQITFAPQDSSIN